MTSPRPPWTSGTGALHALAAWRSAIAVLDATGFADAERRPCTQLLAALRAEEEQQRQRSLPEHARAAWRIPQDRAHAFLQVPTTLAVDLRRRAAH